MGGGGLVQKRTETEKRRKEEKRQNSGGAKNRKEEIDRDGGKGRTLHYGRCSPPLESVYLFSPQKKSYW